MAWIGDRVAVIGLLVVLGVLGTGNALFGVEVVARSGRRTQANIISLDAFSNIVGVYFF